VLVRAMVIIKGRGVSVGHGDNKGRGVGMGHGVNKGSWCWYGPWC